MSAVVKSGLERFARSEFRFFTPSPTRWGDCDMFGHVNNVEFVRYFETGRLDYFRRVLNLETGPNPTETLVIADLRVSFLQQINHPCEIEVGVRISRLGNSSFDFETALFAPGESDPRSTAHAVCVWFDFRNNRSAPIPASVRSTVQKFEGLEA